MAIDQEAQQRSITLPVQQVNAGNGLQQLGNATAQIGQLINNRVSDVAVEKSATQGALDAEAGSAPKNLIAPFTKSTKAYNEAVARTEANRSVITAQQLINESLENSKNPATFNSNTPAAFKASLEGIKSGLLKNARPETRAELTQKIDHLSNLAQLNMLQHSISFDNEQANANLKHDITGLLEARRNASIAGDAERVSGIDAALDSSLKDYSTMNAQIARNAPYLRADIEKHRMIDKVLGGFSDAIENKTTTQFMANLAENKDHIPYNVWQDAVKGVVALDQEHKRLNNDINAQQLEQVKLGINNGSIQDASDILNYPALTIPQKLASMNLLYTTQAKQMKQGSEFITAQQNILRGRPEVNSGSTRDKMFMAQLQAMEQHTGKVSTLVDMEQSVLGQSQFPASGMPNTAIGTNVPAFDSVMQGKLTGGDIEATAQAGMVFNDMVNIKDQPNSVSLNGDALAVATLFGELYQGGTTPEQAAEQAINTVLNAKEPEIAQRIDRFHKTLEKIDPRTGNNALVSKFKQAFGQAPQAFVSDQAFKLFSDIYRANYISSNSEEGAFKATKYAMQKWGTSKYFDKGFVGQPVPEKEIPLTKVGNSFGNQIVSNLQGYINRTAAAREAHPELGIPNVEWADPKQSISFQEPDTDKVFKKMTIGNRPRIKIDGHETEVVLIPSATSRLGKGGLNYLFGAYDKFNNLHPLKDVTNPTDQVARFAPLDLSLWSPEIANKNTDEALRGYASKVLDEENPVSFLLPLPGLSMDEKYLKSVEKNADARNDEGRLNKIIESLRGTSAAVTRDDITDAGNVGISPDSIHVIGEDNNIDTKPRVKNNESQRSMDSSIAETKRERAVSKNSNNSGAELNLPTTKNESKTLKSESEHPKESTVKDNFKKNVEIIFPKVNYSEVQKIISSINFESPKVVDEVIKALSVFNQMNSKSTPNEEKQSEAIPFEDVSSKSHSNKTLLNKTINEIKSLKGSVNSDNNKHIVSNIIKLYPNLSEKQSETVIENFFFILNKKKLSENA